MAEYTIVQIKRDSTLNWYASNPRLALGEPGVDMDLHRFKIGNGIDRWNELPYMDDDLYKLLSEQDQKTADKVQDLLNKIAANKLDADQKYNAVTSELRNTSRDLTGRMSDVETSQQEYQENLTERQQKFEEAVTGDFEDTKAEVQAGLDEFNETRDSLIVRMDMIVGQATEDTEILDARTDAEYRTYPNLGTNIRNIHRQLLEEKQTREGDKSDLDTEIAALRQAGTQEQQARMQTDEGHEERLSELKDSTEKLFTKDTVLQEQADENAEGILRTVLTLGEEILRTRKEFSRAGQQRAKEQQAREAEDADLSARIDVESRYRKVEDENISARMDAQSHELRHERSQRVEDTEELGRRIDELSGATIEKTLLLKEEGDKLRAERVERVQADEDLSRIHGKHKDFLQEQADETAGEVIGLNIRLYQEQQARKQKDTAHDEKIDTLDDELKNTCEVLSKEARQVHSQMDTISDAVLCEAIEHVREHEKRVEAEAKLAVRITQGHEELDERLRHEENARIEQVKRFNAEIKPVADALVREGLDRYEEHNRLQTRLEHEESSRALGDDFQNEQINELGSLGIQQAVRLYHERKERQADIQGVNEWLSREEKTRAEIDQRITEKLEHEALLRETRDELLQEQLEQSARGLFGAAYEMHSAREKLNTDIEHESRSRIAAIDRIQEQTDELTGAVIAEAIGRRNDNHELRQKITDATAELEGLVADEMSLREEKDEELSGRIETVARQSKVHAEHLQEQADELAEASLKNLLNIVREAGERQELDVNIRAVIAETAERLEAADERETEQRQQKDTNHQTQVNDLAEAVLYMLLNGYRAREKIKARIRVMEQALVDAGVLDESDVPPMTDTEIDGMLEDIFSGNTSGEAIEPADDEEAEFLEDIHSIFNP